MDNIDKIRRIRLLIKTLSSIKIIELIEENPKMGVIVHLGPPDKPRTGQMAPRSILD
jgi:hypothetical protein